MYTDELIAGIREAGYAAAWGYIGVVGVLFLVLVVLPALWNLLRD